MTEIQNPKREYDLEERTFPKRFFHQFLKNQNDLNSKSEPVLVIEYCDLRFICNLPARRFSGGVLGI